MEYLQDCLNRAKELKAFYAKEIDRLEKDIKEGIQNPINPETAIIYRQNLETCLWYRRIQHTNCVERVLSLIDRIQKQDYDAIDCY